MGRNALGTMRNVMTLYFYNERSRAYLELWDFIALVLYFPSLMGVKEAHNSTISSWQSHKEMEDILISCASLFYVHVCFEIQVHSFCSLIQIAFSKTQTWCWELVNLFLPRRLREWWSWDISLSTFPFGQSEHGQLLQMKGNLEVNTAGVGWR